MASLPLYGAEELPDSARREESYEHTEYSPLRTTYEVWGWNIPRYYYYQYLHIFADYPWVVRVAYGIVFFCIIGFFFIALAMFIDVYYTERSKRFYAKIRKKYFEKMKDICYASVDNLSIKLILWHNDALSNSKQTIGCLVNLTERNHSKIY